MRRMAGWVGGEVMISNPSVRERRSMEREREDEVRAMTCSGGGKGEGRGDGAWVGAAGKPAPTHGSAVSVGPGERGADARTGEDLRAGALSADRHRGDARRTRPGARDRVR